MPRLTLGEWRFFAYKSELGEGAWVNLTRIKRLDKGKGVVGFMLLAGADKDIPLRPWPQIFAERRPTGAVLVCAICCGVGIGFQIP